MNRSGGTLQVVTKRATVRLVAGAASALVASAGVVTLAAAPSARATVSAGQGSSFAESLQVAPHDGSLAVGVVLGESLAGHTNGDARAQSQGLDLGAVGTDLTGYNCGSRFLQPNQIPQALTTETGQPGAAKGITQTVDPATGAAQPSFGTYEHVEADPAPYGEADTAVAPLGLGPITVTNMSTKAWSGIVDGQREAGATSDIGALDLGSLVQLGGLHWQSVYPSGGSAQPSGSFTLGSLKIDGFNVPVGMNLAPLQKLVNSVLGAVGVELLLPVSSVSQGVQSVTPLEIEAVPNATRDNLLNVALNATEAQQQALFGGLENGFPGEPTALASALCESDSPITVAQVAIASINGGGFLSIGLGGVNSSSSAVSSNPFQLGGLGGGIKLGSATSSGAASSPIAPSPPASSSGIASGSGSVAVTPAGAAVSAVTPSGGPSGGASPGAAPGAGSAPAAATSPAPVQQAAAVSRAAPAGYAAGGPLLAIGLAGLGFLALLAEGDRRMMRRAQHTVQFEE